MLGINLMVYTRRELTYATIVTMRLNVDGFQWNVNGMSTKILE